MVKEFFIPTSPKFNKAWGDATKVGYVQFTLFGILVAKVTKETKDGIFVTFEPSEHYTEEIHKKNKELFKGFFDDEDVPEIKSKLVKTKAVGPESIPTPPAKPEKKPGRPPKDKPVAAAAVADDDLAIPVVSFDD